MIGEVFQINVEANLAMIEEIFDKPNISCSFEKGCKENEFLIRTSIVEYRNELLTNHEFEIEKELIPFDDELILSDFKIMLRGQILATAIANVFTEMKFNIEENILELTNPVNMMQLFPYVLETVFSMFIRNALFEDDEVQNTGQMFS